MRKINCCDEFFDLLDKVGVGKQVSIGYITGANLDIPTIKKINPNTNKLKSYEDYNVFGTNVAGLIKITEYTLTYKHRDDVNKEYDEYKKDFDKIRAEYNIPPVKKKSPDKLVSEPSNNVQNTYGAKLIGSIYKFDGIGNIIDKLEPEEVEAYLKKPSQLTGIGTLKKIGATKETIEEYYKKVSSLHVKYKRFDPESTLWIKTDIDGEDWIYVNEKPSKAVNGIEVKQEDLLKIIQEKVEI